MRTGWSQHLTWRRPARCGLMSYEHISVLVIAQVRHKTDCNKRQQCINSERAPLYSDGGEAFRMPKLYERQRRSEPIAMLCRSCGKPMQLFFREKHPSINGSEIVAYECTRCPGPVVAETIA